MNRKYRESKSKWSPWGKFSDRTAINTTGMILRHRLAVPAMHLSMKHLSCHFTSEKVMKHFRYPGDLLYSIVLMSRKSLDTPFKETKNLTEGKGRGIAIGIVLKLLDFFFKKKEERESMRPSQCLLLSLSSRANKLNKTYNKHFKVKKGRREESALCNTCTGYRQLRC